MLNNTLDYEQLQNLWMIAFGRYLQGKGHPTTDIFTVSAGKRKADGPVADNMFWSCLFLEAVTASPYLPVDNSDVIQVIAIISYHP